MTIWQRIRQIVIGLVLLPAGFLLMMFGGEVYPLIIGLYSLALEIYGVRKVWYFFRMARYMTGGRRILYRGILAFDFGIFAGSLVRVPQIYILLYLTGTMAFSGLVDILRARESREIEGPWKMKTFQGATEIGVAVLCVLFLRSTDYVVDIFAMGLIFSAVMRILSAFRRTPVIMID